MVMHYSLHARVLLAAACWGLAAGTVSAAEPQNRSTLPSYRAVPGAKELWPGEPFVIELTALDASQTQTPGVWPSLSGVRRLRAEISRVGDSAERWTVILFQRSAATASAQRGAAYVYVGSLRFRNPNGGGVVLIQTPGEYTLNLQNPEYPEALPIAEPVTFSVREFRGESERAAFKLFESGSMDLLLTGEPMAPVVNENIRTLAERYPETRYGRYAVALVAQAGYEEQVRKPNAHSKEAWSLVASRLAAALEGLPAGQPLREEVMWHLVRAEAQAGEFGSAKEHARSLGREFPESKHGRKARSMVQELNIAETRPAKP